MGCATPRFEGGVAHGERGLVDDGRAVEQQHVRGEQRGDGLAVHGGRAVDGEQVAGQQRLVRVRVRG